MYRPIALTKFLTNSKNAIWETILALFQYKMHICKNSIKTKVEKERAVTDAVFFAFILTCILQIQAFQSCLRPEMTFLTVGCKSIC